MNKYFFLISLLFCFFGQAQSYKGSIEKASSNEMYLIYLEPKVRLAMKNNVSAIRIFDTQKNEVPYTVFQPNNNLIEKKIKLSILKKEITKDSITSWIIENKEKKYINQFLVEIANTSIQKSYSVSGSNDGNEWFGLVQNQELYMLENNTNKTFEKLISFPISNYKFFKINVSDKKSLPINLLSVSYLQSNLNYVNHIELDGFKISKIESTEQKKSLFTITFDEPQQLSKIGFQIKSKLFKRNARIYAHKTNKKKRVQEIELTRFILSSSDSNKFELPEILEKVIYVEIENNDNPSLVIEKIQLFQKPLYLIANLESNTNYSMNIDENREKPIYDLENFIPENTKDLKILKILDFKKEETNSIKSSQKFWQTKWFLWICLILGGSLVAYFAFSLLKDMKSND